MGNVTITLHVNTANISPGNVNANCHFTDSNNDPTTANPEDFQTNCDLNDVLTWEGVPTDSSLHDSVSITKIAYKSGTNLFGKSSLPGHNGTVTGTVDHGTGGDIQIYGMNFDVTRNGTTKSYRIDPKIRVNN